LKTVFGPLGYSNPITARPLPENSHFYHGLLGDPNNGDNTIVVFLETTLPPGEWVVRLHGVAVRDGEFHAWIEGGPRGQSCFETPDPSHTVGSISCGRRTIVVGAYDALQPDTPIAIFSSAGPTRDARQKPELSAPGNNVLAAHSRTGTKAVKKSGTSMAAPAVAGTVALMLAEAAFAKRSLAAGEIRDILVKTAVPAPRQTEGTWDPRFGFGKVSARAAVAQAAGVASATG
jgi:hypothetical protein